MILEENELEIKKKIAFVSGGISFYPKKTLKTLTTVTKTFYDNWDEEAYRHYLKIFKLDESKKADQLSEGMKVKYLLSLAMSHDAKFLILDEPTSGLDPVFHLQIVLCIPMSFLRGKVLTYPNLAGIEADVAFYGGALLIFTVFNWMFFSSYFKDVFKAEDLIKQIPILLCCIILFVVMNMLRYKLDVKHFEAQDF